ncbi:MAG: type II toxin-antitoxin system RelE/ParE family toxin [Acidobacteria bacterium]|uniref:Type II toxin-antitoxin system RelE/ParE family toxin n=1 Tax=Candidatus Polarisedimenticola svalbardensis TaxID=2886004 RepID=A0A8J6XZ11_9BACT|nr:type II toxin-antitoxin system RelE/ParE family toxin [Candidatus Polarisedimenticola svalbardensis]
MADLDSIHASIARDSPYAARRWVGRLWSEAQQLETTPWIGRVVPELQREEIRELLIRNYRLVYQVGEKTVDILTVFERHRRFPADSSE